MNTRPIRVAMLATDARECFCEYEKTEPYFGQAPEALFQGVPKFSQIEMHVISCWKKPMSAPAKLAENIWFHGLVVPRIGWVRTAFQGCVRAARKKIQELKPDLVHGQGTERDCAISAVFSGFPNVITIHGNMNALARLFRARIGTYSWGMARLEDFTLKRTDGVFCNSAYTERLVRHRTTRTWRVPNAIRSTFFEAGPSATSSDEAVLVNVGVISERKRQLELLRLARELHRDAKFELWFVGKADQSAYAARFLDEVRSAEKGGWARYLGVQSGEQLVQTFNKADGMIHFPSEEAFGLVVAEGLARNLKFFGSKVGGIVEIASDVEAAELIDPDDWETLTVRIRNWIEAGHPRAQLAAEKIRQRYHPEAIMKQHVTIYEEVLRTCS